MRGIRSLCATAITFALLSGFSLSSAFAQVTASINGPKESGLGDLVVLDASRSSGTQYRWLLVNSKKAFLPVDNGQKAVFSSGTPGEFLFVLVVAGIDSNQRLDVAIAEHRLVVGTPPVDPVNPTPSPAPTPVVADQLRVLILYDPDTRATLPADQQRILESNALREYLNKKCSKGPDGKTAEWRIWPSDVLISDDLPVWRKALDEPRTSKNWLLVSNAKAGYSGPLPASEVELMTILKKYGGE